MNFEPDTSFLSSGSPARPEGPIEIADITGDGCKLEWKPPKDDGGKKIKYVESNKLFNIF